MGAEIIESPSAEGSNGAVRRAQELAQEHPDWMHLNQYGNDANAQAHYEGTGPEIWRDCPEITHFVSGLGTSGTIVGAGTYLREQNGEIEIRAVEAPVGETLDGLRSLDDGYVPPIFESWAGADLLDRRLIVRPRESIEAVRTLLSRCGIFGGLSTGAAFVGAARAAAEIDAGVIVFIAADGGWKYLSTGAWTEDLDIVAERARNTIYF